ERCWVEGRDPIADDLDDKDPEANEEKPGQPGQDLAVIASAEQKLQRKTGCEQEKDAGPQEIGGDVDQAEICTAHRPSFGASLDRRRFGSGLGGCLSDLCSGAG